MSDSRTWLLYGALGVAGAYYLLSLNRQNLGRAKAHQMQKDNAYLRLRQPIIDLKSVLFSKTIGAKDAKLLWKERGPCGTVKFVYELPTGHRVFSYLPLDFWTAH